MVSPLFFLLLFGVLLVIGLLVTGLQRQKLNETYCQLARQFDGTCQPGGFFARPSAHFFHAGFPVTVDIYSTGGEHPTYYTQVHLAWQDRNFRCELYPEGIWASVRKLIGMEDVEIGSPEFDRSYIIHGSDRAGIRTLLNGPVQLKIDQLRRFLGNGDIYISFGFGVLLVKKLSLIKDVDVLLRFVRLALELYDEAALTLGQGIEFVPQTEAPKAGEVICQVCGEAVTYDVVFCRRCKTPHHRDCWEYNGACSTYGCRETRFLLPKAKRKAPVR